MRMTSLEAVLMAVLFGAMAVLMVTLTVWIIGAMAGWWVIQ